MKIAHDAILMDSSRTYLEKDEVKESLKAWVDPPQRNTSSGNDSVTISSKAEALLNENGNEIDEAELAQGTDREVSLKKLIAELLSGMKIEPVHIGKVRRQEAKVQDPKAGNDTGSSRQGWGLQYDRESTHSEKEDVSFNAKGVIKTSDGKEISFSLSLDMSREYLEKNNVHIRAGDAAIDPLVLNFDGKAAELTDQKFAFDLNADGVQEEISMPTQGRGFLALDHNGDGVVNNGNELFGPGTGNGFTELQAYDRDGNSWIDENDAVFDRLGIMTVDSEGASSLQSLKESGVGAISLGKESTRFDIRAAGDNALQGQVRSTGIFLKEDGTPDTIQLLDLMA